MCLMSHHHYDDLQQHVMTIDAWKEVTIKAINELLDERSYQIVERRTKVTRHTG
jgi:hypothetical protein